MGMRTFHQGLDLCAWALGGGGDRWGRDVTKKASILLPGMLPSPTDFTSSDIIQDELLLTIKDATWRG